MARKPKQSIEKGPISERVSANIRRLRESKGMTQFSLGERMDALGRHINTAGLSRVETGERRVDVDDLVAFAVALEVNPNVLLLGDDGDPMELAPELWASSREAWRWAAGDAPLASSGRSSARFRKECRPHIREEFSLATVGQHWQKIEKVITGLEELDAAGVTPEEVLAILTARRAEQSGQ